MGKPRSFTLASLLIYFYVLQGAVGIEFLFSQDDMSIDSYYDVDDSVAVDEEASATHDSGITDRREVSGKGRIYAYQQLSSGNLWAALGAHGPEGRYVSSRASITPTALHARQSASVLGLEAYAFVDGEKNYDNGLAYTWQDAGADDGRIATTQWVTLGDGIYSGQNIRASGLNPYATGFAVISSPPKEMDGVNDQIAFIELGALEEGSISGRLGATAVSRPEYNDPVVYGSCLEASGDEAAGLVAGTGSFDGILPEDFFISGSLFENDPESLLSIFNSENLIANGAITGAVGVGPNSLASADYIKAGTDGHESYAYSENTLAKGDSLAAVAAAAGRFKNDPGDGFIGEMDELRVQGALAGAIGSGKNSRASARYLEAADDYWEDYPETYALGEKMDASGSSFAAVLAGAGYLRDSSLMTQSEYNERLYVDGALAGAAGAGEDSKASAKYLEADIDYWDTYAFGKKMDAKGNSLAAVAAGAGNLEIGSKIDASGDSGYIDVQGALAGSVGSGENSEASARYLEAGTGYWDGNLESYAFGNKMKAKGDSFAAVAAGAGDLEIGSDSGILGKGALAIGLAEGKNSEVSARRVVADTEYDWDTKAKVKGLDASGENGVLGGAWAVYGPVEGAVPVDLTIGGLSLGSWPVSVAGVSIELSKGALRNAGFKAKLDWSEETMTAKGKAELDDALGTASAFTENPSSSDSRAIDTAKVSASMDAKITSAGTATSTVNVS